MKIRKLRAAGLLLASGLVVGACATGSSGVREAQNGRAPGDGIGCLDTLHATDSLTRVVKLTISPQDTGAKLPADFENLFADEFRRRFKAPPRMPLSVVKGLPPCDSLGLRCASGILDIGAVAYVTAHNNGKLSDIGVLDIALVPSLADSVTAVLSAISREALVPPIGDADAIPLIVQLEPEDQPDSIPTYRQIFRAKIPRYGNPFSYASMSAAGIDATYPFTARIAGVGDSVTVAFTVMADGSITPKSIEVVRASYRDFVASVADALLDTRYHPARLGDCAVATRMEQRFLFKLPD